jgi:hypothetical protein
MTHCKSGLTYFQVSARSAKWGMNKRKTFPNEKEALDHARQIEEQLQINGAQPAVPKEVKIQADAYAKLIDRPWCVPSFLS